MKKILIILLSILLIALAGCSLFKDNEPEVQQNTIDYFSQWYTDTKDLTFEEYSKSYNGYNFMIISPEHTVELHIIYNEDGSYGGVYTVKEGNDKDRKVIESYPVKQVTNEVIQIQVGNIEKSIPTSVLFFKQYEPNYYQIKVAKIDYIDDAKPFMSGRYTNQDYFQNISTNFISLVQTERIKDSFDKILLSNESAGLYMEDPTYNSDRESPYTYLSFPRTGTSIKSIKLGYPYLESTYDADLMIIESPSYQIN
ncbi:hypothetical protein HB943_03455 [Listeria weihenstephanensis]|uniref:Lipoprotein n=1 Tax=Listeria weihenstephanensis TaxID=1006155 RepID=A0A841Z5A3_9LIST|nr:hypothetical protein [Listeria weihenstephanensis]MBC1499647.1 hypothetical protein [Listeria weihenstephanensis]